MKRLSCVALSAVAIFSFMFAGCAVTGQAESLSSSTAQPDSAAALATQPQASQPSSVVLFQQDFEGAKGHWAGRIITEGVPAGSTRALAAVANETHWARRASVHNRGVIRAVENTVLTFRYRISKDLPLTIYVMDRAQQDNLRYDINKPVVGAWTDVRLNINTDFRRNDGSAGKLQRGDHLTNISFLSGKTGTDEFDLAVDDIRVTGQK
jgi:hypothetical protein